VLLKNTNNDVMENPKNGDNSLKDSEPFKKHLGTVLVQLKEASGQSCALLIFALTLYMICMFTFRFMCCNLASTSNHFIYLTGLFCFTQCACLAETSSQFLFLWYAKTAKFLCFSRFRICCSRDC
jgi:hypothetical protein